MTTYNSRSDYFNGEGLPQAVKLFDELKSRKAHGVSLAMSLDQLRQRIDALPVETRLQVALAELWLDLGQKDGRNRRKNTPPRNPFVKEGAALKAAKQDILAWDAAWRLKEGVSELAQKLQRSGAHGVNRTAHILRAKLLWLVEQGDVLGWIGELPEEALTQASVPEMTVKAWTMNDALLQPWREPQEQALWVQRFAAGNRLLEAEAQARTLAAIAARNKAKPDITPAI